MNYFYDEFKKYQIPTDDVELLDWLVKGDPSSTKEGWNFYIRCIFSSVEFARAGAPLRGIFYQMTGKFCTAYNEEEEQCLDYQGNYHTYPAVGLDKFVPCEKELLDFISGKNLSIIEQVREFAKNVTVSNVEEFYASKNESFNNYRIITDDNFGNLASKVAIELFNTISDEYRKVYDIKNMISDKEKRIIELKQYIQILEDLNIDEKESKQILRDFRINGLTKGIKKRQIEKLINKFKLQIDTNNTNIANFQKKIDKYPENIRKALEELLKTARQTVDKKDEDIVNIAKSMLLLEEPYLQSIIQMILTCKDLTIEDYKKIMRKLNEISYHVESHLPQLSIKEFVSEIRSNAYIFQELFNDKILAETDLEKLSEGIRKLMIGAKLTSERSLAISYRNIVINDNDGYISGAGLTTEEISIQMKNLAERFNIAQQINDMTEYVQECTNIFHDYIRLHPYSDGNGRCSRMLLQVMLAKRGIFLPSLYETHYDCLRYYKTDNFRYCCDQAKKNNDNGDVISYICDRVNKFYPNLLQHKSMPKEIIPSAAYRYNPDNTSALPLDDDIFLSPDEIAHKRR